MYWSKGGCIYYVVCAFIIMMFSGKEEPSPYFWRNFLFFAAGSKLGMLIFLLGGPKSLSQALLLVLHIGPFTR